MQDIIEWTRDSIDILSIVTIATLISTITSVLLQMRSSKFERSQVAPWKIAKTESGDWLIERNSPTLATIYGDTIVSHGTLYSEGRLKPHYQNVFFAKGRTFKIAVDEYVEGDKLVIAYVEHSNDKKGELTPLSGYNKNFYKMHKAGGTIPRFTLWPLRYRIRAPYVKIWEAYLY